MQRSIFFFILGGLVLLWIGRMLVEYDRLAAKTENPEYQAKIREYKNQVETEYQDVINRLTKDFGVEYDGNAAGSGDACVISNFEGASVKIAGVRLFDKIYRRQSQSGIGQYQYECNEVTLDPDHPYYGLPDINITVGGVEYYQPEEKSFAKIFNREFNGDPKPYKVYKKTLMVRDSSDRMVYKTMDIQLWLATFNAVITVRSTRDNPGVNIPESEMDKEIYPGQWYGGSGKVSINDLRNKRENQENLYGDLSFILEIDPNASPWYVNLPDAQTARPDIAVASLYCQHLKTNSLEEGKIHLNTFAGSAEPLFYTPFENRDSLQLGNDLEGTARTLQERALKLNRMNIWNRPYYVRLNSRNIGSRRQLMGINQQDDQINLTFLLPLFVVGNMDMVIPSDILPEWDPPNPYVSKFSLRNLLPQWGLAGVGTWLSGIIVAVIVIMLIVTFFPAIVGNWLRR